MDTNPLSSDSRVEVMIAPDLPAVAVKKSSEKSTGPCST